MINLQPPVVFAFVFIGVIITFFGVKFYLYRKDKRINRKSQNR